MLTCRQCGIKFSLTWATHTGCAPASVPWALGYLMVVNETSKPCQGVQTVHDKNSPFLMWKERGQKEQREVRGHEEKREWERDCSVCPRSTALLPGQGSCNFMFGAWHNVLPVIETWKSCVFDNIIKKSIFLNIIKTI